MYTFGLSSEGTLQNSDAIQVDVSGLIVELKFIDDNTGLPADISTATIKKIYFKKPDGVVIEKDASFLTDGKDGIIFYVTTEGDIDVSGMWYLQGYIEDGNFQGHSSISSFLVVGNLN